MSAPVRDRSAELTFSPEEAWVVHAALLARIDEVTEAGGPDDGVAERGALSTLESDADRFPPAQVRAIHLSLVGYLADAPLRDRPHARAALATVNDAL